MSLLHSTFTEWLSHMPIFRLKCWLVWECVSVCLFLSCSLVRNAFWLCVQFNAANFRFIFVQRDNLTVTFSYKHTAITHKRQSKNGHMTETTDRSNRKESIDERLHIQYTHMFRVQCSLRVTHLINILNVCRRSRRMFSFFGQRWKLWYLCGFLANLMMFWPIYSDLGNLPMFFKFYRDFANFPIAC